MKLRAKRLVMTKTNASSHLMESLVLESEKALPLITCLSLSSSSVQLG